MYKINQGIKSNKINLIQTFIFKLIKIKSQKVNFIHFFQKKYLNDLNDNIFGTWQTYWHACLSSSFYLFCTTFSILNTGFSRQEKVFWFNFCHVLKRKFLNKNFWKWTKIMNSFLRTISCATWTYPGHAYRAYKMSFFLRFKKKNGGDW